MFEQIRNRTTLKWLAIGLLAMAVLLPVVHLPEAAHDDHATQTCELCLLLDTTAFLFAGIVVSAVILLSKSQHATMLAAARTTPRRPVGRAPPGRS